jgi:hypothetical protein
VTVQTMMRTSVQLIVHLSGVSDGIVRLIAVRTQEYTAASDVLVALSQSRYYWSVSAQTPVTASVDGLLPYTKYDVYCAATSSAGVPMQRAAVLSSKTALRTLCCKTVTVAAALPLTTYPGTALSSAISVTLDASPTEAVGIAVGLISAVDGNSGGVALLPASLRYTNSSSVSAAPQRMQLTALSPGSYTLIATVTGPSAQEYRFAYLGPTQLTVLSPDAIPAVPRLLQAVFSDDGSYVSLTFDSATDRAGLYGTFPCSAVLRSSAANCQWSGDSDLRLYSKATAAEGAVIVGSNVTVVAGKIRARCTSSQGGGQCASYLAVQNTTVAVAAPAVPVVPSVVIVAPAAIGGCNALTLDLTGSAGAAGRPWSCSGFEVVTSPDSVVAAARLRQFLTRNYTLSPPTPVPSAELEKGYAYTIKVTLCNFLMACGSAVHTVTVALSEQPIPIVTIAGQRTRTMYRAEALSVLVDAYTQSCSGGRSSANLLYSWTATQLLPGASRYTNATVQSSSQNPAVFKLPAYTLSVGATYTLTVSVLSTQSSRRASAAVQVQVLQSDLVAVLKGGSTRYVVVGEVITLDASSSYDKDYPGVALGSGTVAYAWSCLTVAPVASASCAAELGAASLIRPGVINVTSTYTALNTTSVITVTVSDATRSSAVQMRVIILQAPSPRLEITPAGSTSNVNTGKPLTLLGSLYLLAPCAATWSVDNPTIVLSGVARTPVQQLLLPTLNKAAVTLNLVLRPNVLPQRSTLQFSLSCGSATTAVSVTTNGAPMPGSFVVYPAAGQELVTVFTFAASQWSDPDVPLTYLFGFKSAVCVSNLVIVSRTEVSYATTSLPAGDVSRADAVDCSLRVFDALEAYSDLTTSTAVRTITDSAQSSQLLLDLIQSSAGTIEAAKSALAVASTVLNAVNCTGAPDCVALNRSPCQRTSGQCGVCLAGYVGDSGDRNSLCVLPSSAAAMSTVKVCGRNCSFHGECVHLSRVTGTLVRLCALVDTTCEATCSCTDQYSGEFCEIASDSLHSRRAVRSNLVRA